MQHSVGETRRADPPTSDLQGNAAEEFVMPGSSALAKKSTTQDPWRDFSAGAWRTSLDVRDFIVENVNSYDGDESFLALPTERTKAVWAKLQPYFKDEQKKGV